jgi:membrane protein DedA with SNARE-associated domain
VIDWMLAQPFWAAAALLTAVAAVRSQCTYLLGRGLRRGLVKAQWAQRMAARAAGAETRLERYGWPAIPLSFLTVGLQTAVNLAAGLVGWRWGRYTLAAVPGWLAWGLAYAAGGLAIWAGIGVLWDRSPVLVAAIVEAVCVIAVAFAAAARRRRRAPAEATREKPVVAK